MRYIIACFFFLIAMTASAKDLGVWGETWGIAENDLVQVIKKRLSAMEASGELAMHQQKIQEHTEKRVKRPKPVPGVVRATSDRVFYYDPTFIVEQDIRNNNGEYIARKGDKINPLEKISYSKELYFIDGDDKQQFAWYQSNLSENTKLILVSGSPLELSEELEGAVYFDQQGVLCKRFGIKQVPARVITEGNRFKIEEIALPLREQPE